MRFPLRRALLAPVLCLLSACESCNDTLGLQDTVSLLVASPSELNFGGVFVGAVTARTVKLQSQGNGDVYVGELRLEGPGAGAYMFHPGGPTSLAPGAELAVLVSFRPTSTGDHRAFLVASTDASNTSEVRVQLTGTGDAPPDCDDHNPCTTEFFDPVAGTCTSAHVVGPCDDDSACTQADRCVDGACLGAAVRCSDALECTRDLCDPTRGCVFLADPLACEDGNSCTVEYCDADGACGHVSLPDGTPCVSVALCELGDRCFQGQCRPQDAMGMPVQLSALRTFGAYHGRVLVLGPDRLVFADEDRTEQWFSIVDVDPAGRLKLKDQAARPVTERATVLEPWDANRFLFGTDSGWWAAAVAQDGHLTFTSVATAAPRLVHMQADSFLTCTPSGTNTVAVQCGSLDNTGTWTAVGPSALVGTSLGCDLIADPMGGGAVTRSAPAVRLTCTSAGVTTETAPWPVDAFTSGVSLSTTLVMETRFDDPAFRLSLRDGTPVDMVLPHATVHLISDHWIVGADATASWLAEVNGTDAVAMHTFPSSLEEDVVPVALTDELLVVAVGDPNLRGLVLRVFRLSRGQAPRMVTGELHGPMGELVRVDDRLFAYSSFGTRELDPSVPHATRALSGGHFPRSAHLVSFRPGARSPTAATPGTRPATSLGGLLDRDLTWMDASRPDAPLEAGVLRLVGGVASPVGHTAGQGAHLVSVRVRSGGAELLVHKPDNASPGGLRVLQVDPLGLVLPQGFAASLGRAVVDERNTQALVSVESTLLSTRTVLLNLQGETPAVVATSDVRLGSPFILGTRLLTIDGQVGGTNATSIMTLWRVENDTFTPLRALTQPVFAQGYLAFDGRYAVVATQDGAGFLDTAMDPMVWLGEVPLGGPARGAERFGTSLVLTTDTRAVVLSPPCPPPMLP